MALLVIELIQFIALCVFRPFRRTATNVLEIFLALVRVFSIGLLIPFIASLNVNRYVVTGALELAVVVGAQRSQALASASS